MAYRSSWVIRACFLAPFLSLSKSLWGIVALRLDIRAFLPKTFFNLIIELDTDLNLQMKDLSKNISLLDAIYLLEESWAAVKESTIVNCYRHSGFHKNPLNGEDFDLLNDVNLPANLSLGLCRSKCRDNRKLYR